MAVSLLLQLQPGTAVQELEQMRTMFASNKPGFLRESVDSDALAFNWSQGVVASAEVATAKLSKNHLAKLSSIFLCTESYWNPNGPVAGFDVLPGPNHPNDRYYDDNAWVAMTLIDAYELTRNQKYLDKAISTNLYILSGWDDQLGGGIYWKEREKASKNACANGPAAAVCIALYEKNHDRKWLVWGAKIYDWTRKNLRDPDDELYWDNIDLKGKIEKTKWSYNSALMLRSAKALARLTKKTNYREDAEKLEAACIRHWVKSDGVIDDELQFSHLLFENLDPAKFDAAKCIAKLVETRDERGWFGHRWGGKPLPRQKLITQASGVRAVAIFEGWKRAGLIKK